MEISEEQYAKYSRQCPACFAKTKRSGIIGTLIVSLLFFGIATYYLVTYSTGVAAGLHDVNRLIQSIGYVLFGQFFLFMAWRWKFTDVLPWKYDKVRVTWWWLVSLLPWFSASAILGVLNWAIP